MGAIRRRAFIAAACGATTALAACASPFPPLLTADFVPSLRVRLIGFPPDAAKALGQALQRCAQAYFSASRGLVVLDITQSPVPDIGWYTTATCGSGPGCFAEAARLDSFQALQHTPELGQLWIDGVPSFLVRGRTRYGIKFGDGTLAPPQPADTTATLPDLVLAYDLWQYWLAPFAQDMASAWRLYSDDHDGLPDNLDRLGHFYAPSAGTFFAALPILRNPMVLFGGAAVAGVSPWDWSHVIQAILGGQYSVSTAGFSQDPLYPESTEAAVAAVVAYGGTIAHTGASSCVPTFARPPAADAVAAITGLAKRAPRPRSGVSVGLRPSYLWDALWGARRDCWSCFPSGPIQPLPAGPVRKATPCMYLCATVVASGGRLAAAEDFASFLLNRAAQAELANWAGGLPLRPSDALAVLRHYPAVQPPEEIASSSADLTAADVFGADQTPGNQTGYDAVADAFASSLASMDLPAKPLVP